LHHHPRPRRRVPGAGGAADGLDIGAAALRQRHGGPRPQPPVGSEVHPYPSPLQHRSSPVRDEVRLPAWGAGDPRGPRQDGPGAAPLIIVMSHQASPAQVDAVVEKIAELGLTPEVSKGEDRSVIGVIGGNAYAYREAFAHLAGIQEIVQITKPYKLASREWQTRDTVIDVGGVKIGG